MNLLLILSIVYILGIWGLFMWIAAMGIFDMREPIFWVVSLLWPITLLAVLTPMFIDRLVPGFTDMTFKEFLVELFNRRGKRRQHRKDG